jgi:hydroxymethylglutaryl-CoA reductase (NADPH)
MTMHRESVPRDRDDDFAPAAIAARQAFLRERTGSALEHVARHSIDPAALPGNIESFAGVAQVPIGVVGPLRVNGEHAHGDFYVPLATTEGTLAASYGRGMRILHEAGGVKTTVIDDRMQRAPAFQFADARDARDFGLWLRRHEAEIRSIAEETTRSGRLIEIEQYQSGATVFCRFDYTTGDAAGQNLTGKATEAACRWILGQHPQVRFHVLEANFATDKKASQINTLKTRGKRVVAEATIPNELIQRRTRATTPQMYRSRQLATHAGLLSGSINNGSHSANGITALFIACGQDVANVAESSTALVYTELRENDDYYFSITIPSLIVATYGGGTGLPTQRECLELLGCYGAGKVRKLAEIVAATVLCGEISLASAVAAGEWVDAHDRHGRNRP